MSSSQFLMIRLNTTLAATVLKIAVPTVDLSIDQAVGK